MSYPSGSTPSGPDRRSRPQSGGNFGDDAAESLRSHSELNSSDFDGFSFTREPALALEQQAPSGISLSSLFKNLDQSNQPDPYTRIKCAIALTKCPPEDSRIIVGFVAARLRDEKNPDVRIAMLNALASFKEQAVPALSVIESSINAESVTERVAAFRAFQEAGGDREILARAAMLELSKKGGAIAKSLEILAQNPLIGAGVDNVLRPLFKEEFVDRELEVKKLKVVQAYLKTSPVEVMKIAPEIVEELRSMRLLTDEVLVVKKLGLQNREIGYSPSPIRQIATETLHTFVVMADRYPREFAQSFKRSSDYEGVILLLQSNHNEERKAGLNFAGILFSKTHIPVELANQVLRNFRHEDLRVACDAGRALAKLGEIGVDQAARALSRSVPMDLSFRMAALSTVVEARDCLRKSSPEIRQSVVRSCERIFEDSDNTMLLIKTLNAAGACGRLSECMATKIGKVALGATTAGRHPELQKHALRALSEIGRSLDPELILRVLTDQRNCLEVRVEAARSLGVFGGLASEHADDLSKILKDERQSGSLRQACYEAWLKVTKS